MKLERLTVSGFTRFSEPATLDVSSLPIGLVAICGANGQGKTTMLDSALAVLDLEMPSREGSLADYAIAKDSYLDAIYELNGTRYRARVNVDGIKRASDAVLEQLGSDGKGTPLNDGKVSSFRDARSKLFPPKELLLASAFAPQNRAGSFVTAKPAQRKDLFSALLGMKRFEQLSETAKRCLAIVESALVRLRDRRGLLALETHDFLANKLADHANQVQAESGNAELKRLDLRAKLEGLEAERQQLDEHAAAHLSAVERAQAMLRSSADTRASLRTCDEDVRRADAALSSGRLLADQAERDALATVTGLERKAKDAYIAAVAKLDERIEGNRTLELRAAEIRAAAAAKGEAETTLAGLRERETALRESIALSQEQIRQRERMLREAERSEIALQGARRQAETLTSVPCGGQGDFAGCRFLADAKLAEASIPELEGAAHQAVTLRAGITHWTADAEAHGHALEAVVSQIAAAVLSVGEHAPMARFAPELAATEARIEGYQAEKVSLATALDERVAEYETHRERAAVTKSTAVAQLQAARDERIVSIEARRLDLETQLAGFEQGFELANDIVGRTQSAAQRRDVIDAELPGLRQSVMENESHLARLSMTRAQVDKDRAAFRQKKADLRIIDTRIELASDELLIWQTFVQCFGRDGLPTLEIDAAGPTISNLVNDLLASCFGTRFTLEFVTQEPRADGKGFKESFDLKVFDNQDGGDARDIADLSGGERVIVEEALRAAIALYVNARNVSPVRTIFRDETTGSLDDENAIRYVQMLRRMQELGGIAHVIFVSHNPDVTAMADAQVHVNDGKLEVKLPPYQSAA